MKILTVSELTLALKRQLEPQFADLQLKGEVTNLRAQASGHLYFSLKDPEAQIAAVLFRGSAVQMTRLPKPGDQIIVRGQLSIYAPRGTYQIIVREIEYDGVGQLLLKLHQLKEELKKRGWLDPIYKKSLPKFPKTIGVVTSPTGSVIQDIIHVLKRRYPGFHLILNPVRVQGEGAAKEIAAAIQEFNAIDLVDVIIVARGGGSLEDLWPFNEEIVASAIFHSSIPVISAIGHETDVTLADCVADVRAPTPSAAAEISIQELTSQLTFLKRTALHLDQILRSQFKHAKILIEAAARQPLFASPYAILAEHYQRIDDFSNALDRTMKSKLKSFQEMQLRLARLCQGMDIALNRQLKRNHEKLTHLVGHLSAVNPENILKKGYCIPFAEKGHSVMMSINALEKGMGIFLRFHDGTVKTRIEEINPK